MAFRTQFYSDGSTVYGASDFIAPMNALTTSGIISGLQVSAPSSGMTVNVAAGQGILNGVLTTSDTTVSVTVPTNTGSRARTDAIVLQIDATVMTTTVIDVPGTTKAAANQILLAVVTVPAGASSIVSGNIDSTGRTYAGIERPFRIDIESSHDVTDKHKGHLWLENGILLQWGHVLLAPYPTLMEIDFDIPYDGYPQIFTTMEAVPPAYVSTAVPYKNKFSIMQGGNASNRCHWFAIGYKAPTHS